MPGTQLVPQPQTAPYLLGVGRNLEQQAIQGSAVYLNQRNNGPMMGAPMMRAGTPETLQAGVEPLLALMLIELGTGQFANFFGRVVAPDARKSSWIMNYWSWTGQPQLQIGEEGLVRAFQAERRTAQFTGEFTPTAMTRRGVSVPLDVDEIAIAEGVLQLAGHATLLARDLVQLAVERERQQLFGVPASYPGAHSLDATAAEWNAVGGDSLTDIDAMVDQLLSLNAPNQRESIHVVITHLTRDAVFADPTFLALRAGTESAAVRPDMDAVRDYWGVGQVTLADAVFDPGDGVPVSMWGDVAVGFVDPRLQGGIINSFGRQTFGVTFTFQSGVPSAPFFDNATTTWHYPFDSHDHPAMIQGNAGFIITNVNVNA